MILSVTLNPCVDVALFVEKLVLGDTNRLARVEKDAGGKGVNVSRVVAELAGVTVATGFLGGETGAFVRAVLERQGAGHDFVEVPSETRMNFSLEDFSGLSATTFNAKGAPVSEADWQRFLAKFEALAAGASWVSIGGSAPPGLPPDAYRTLVERAGTRVCLDADGDLMKEGLRGKPHLIKPNAAEAGRLVGRPVTSLEEAVAAAREVLPALAEGGYVLISLGEKGAVLASQEGAWIAHAPKVEAVSTIGSGDSMIAGFLVSHERGDAPEVSLRWGAAAGAATAMTNGAEIGRRPTIEALFERVEVHRA